MNHIPIDIFKYIDSWNSIIQTLKWKSTTNFFNILFTNNYCNHEFNKRNARSKIKQFIRLWIALYKTKTLIFCKLLSNSDYYKNMIYIHDNPSLHVCIKFNKIPIKLRNTKYSLINTKHSLLVLNKIQKIN